MGSSLEAVYTLGTRWPIMTTLICASSLSNIEAEKGQEQAQRGRQKRHRRMVRRTPSNGSMFTPPMPALPTSCFSAWCRVVCRHAPLAAVRRGLGQVVVSSIDIRGYLTTLYLAKTLSGGEALEHPAPLRPARRRPIRRATHTCRGCPGLFGGGGSLKWSELIR